MDNYININTILNHLGLEISSNTGGHTAQDRQLLFQKGPKSIEALTNTGDVIRFLDGSMFLNTLLKTEHSLNVKLFV